MSFQEKNAWIFAAIVVVAYLSYLVIVFGRAQDTPITEVAYAGLMIGSIGAAIVAGIVGGIAAAMSQPSELDRTDERDVSITRYSDALGLYVLSVGILGALALTMLEYAHFWIANAIYLSFVISSLVGVVAKIRAYRRGFV